MWGAKPLSNWVRFVSHSRHRRAGHKTALELGSFRQPLAQPGRQAQNSQIGFVSSGTRAARTPGAKRLPNWLRSFNKPSAFIGGSPVLALNRSTGAAVPQYFQLVTARNRSTGAELERKDGKCDTCTFPKEGDSMLVVEGANPVRPHQTYRPAVAEVAFLLRKHSRQYTGRPCVGLKGTVVSRPHCEQVVMVSDLVNPEPELPCRFVLQFLQRLGSFLKFLSWKKCCSPAVNTKSAPQSTHLRTRSWKSGMATCPVDQLELLSDIDGGGRQSSDAAAATPWVLFNLPAILLPVSLASQRLLGPELLAWFQVKGVPLDLFNDVFLLHFPLEPAKGIL